MITIPYHIYATGTAAASLTSVQAIANGPIVCVTYFSSLDPAAVADDVAAFELSFVAAALGFAQDSRSVLLKWLQQFNFVTGASIGSCSVNGLLNNIHIPWAIGERLYLNLGTPVASAAAKYAGAIVHQAVAEGDFSRMSGRL